MKSRKREKKPRKYDTKKKEKREKHRKIKTIKKRDRKIRDRVNIIENITPIADRIESRKIFQELNTSLHSFSPLINRELVSLKTIIPKNLYDNCIDITKIKIGDRCFDYTSLHAKRLLMDNLRSSKHLDCKYFIAPKQYQANCWFNTMFVTLWFSDKGRKFFRFLRQLMIQGEKINGEKIPPELARVFFVFNMIIEASYNQPFSILNKLSRENSENSKMVNSETRNSFIKDFDTNFFIQQLHEILMKRRMRVYKQGESGNPLEYYKSIIRYLNYDAVNIVNIDIENSASNNNIVREVKKELRNYHRSNTKSMSMSTPEIIVIEIMEDMSRKIRNRPQKIHFSPFISYEIDSCIVRDTEGQHFSSLLTCNGEEMSFDGASYSRLNNFKWKHHLNSEREWGFEGHNLRWSFRNSYQMLFYYRV